MNHIDMGVQKEIDDLVHFGEEIVVRAAQARSSINGKELAQVSSWVTRVGQVTRKLYGVESQQFVNYEKAIKNENFYFIHSNNSEQVSQVLGIAISVKHDYENGLLGNIRLLLQADIFADFLEMGEHLLSEGYKDAAAVIIGTVLEDSLRKLCHSNGIPTTKQNGAQLTLDPMNAELAKIQIYSKLEQKQITTWAHIRNKAAHGEYSEYDKKQVEMMLMFVQAFSNKFLG